MDRDTEMWFYEWKKKIAKLTKVYTAVVILLNKHH